MVAALTPRRAALAAAALALVFALVVANAMRHWSTTFDEIAFPASGARALATGKFNLILDHPRLAQYLYGFPASLAVMRLPVEQGELSQWQLYKYGQQFYFGPGNDPERIALYARLAAVIVGAILVFATFALSRRYLGAGGALLAAALVALLPDMLTHAGISYNDLPGAAAIFIAAYALDAAVREPTWQRGLGAGVATALAVATKASAAILGPMALVFLVAEAASGRTTDEQWRRDLWRALGAFVLAGYAVMLALYPGDFFLQELMGSMLKQVSHVGGDHWGSSMLLLGERNPRGWWYFFPVALVLKTPVALHALAVLAAIGWWRLRGGGPRAWLSSPARVPVVAVLIFGASLLGSRLNIGTRHALPIMPFVCVLIARGVSCLWSRGARPMRALIAVLVVADAVCVLRVYPWFPSYLTEYPRGGLPPYETLVDSSTDWGQGLLGLRDYMRDHGIEQVDLGYFGSALPEGYGIRYRALPSHFALHGNVASSSPSRYVAVSATNLAGVYLQDDPYAALRRAKPGAVAGGSIWIFDREAQALR